MVKTWFVAVALLIAVASEAQYAPAGDIHVGGPGRFDYLAVDSAAKRLYLSHGTEVVVIDTATNKVIGTIADTPGVHGIALAPNGKGFITVGQANQVAIFDPKTLQVVKRVDTGANPDAIVYEPANKEIYALNHTGKSVTVINADSGNVTATIPLSGVAEAGAADPVLGRVYVNIEDTGAVDVIDITTHKVVANWKVAPAEEPTGMAIDTKRGARTMALDPATHKIYTAAQDLLPAPPGGGRAQGVPDSFRVLVYAPAK